jgi:hypothetical protein
MIPDEGRDVQCSNCGHTWFELPPSDFEEFSQDEFEMADDTAEAAPDPADEFIEARETASDQDADDEDASTKEDLSRALPPEADDFFDDITGGARPKPATDPDALDILREEADREMAQRRAPPSDVFESQGDLDLDVRSKVVPTRALRARQAHLDIDSDEPSTRQETSRLTDDDYEEPRRDLLPDIDEINSTLKSTRRRSDAIPEEPNRGGFRFGFALMLLAAIALVLAYVFAPILVKLLPGLEPTLVKYVDIANQFRDWVAGLINGGTNSASS